MKLPSWMNRANIVITVVCVIVGYAFSVTITNIRLANAENKSEWSPDSNGVVRIDGTIEIGADNVRIEGLTFITTEEQKTLACSSGEIDRCDWGYCIAHPKEPEPISWADVYKKVKLKRVKGYKTGCDDEHRFICVICYHFAKTQESLDEHWKLCKVANREHWRSWNNLGNYPKSDNEQEVVNDN